MHKIKYRLLLSGLSILAIYHLLVLFGVVGSENVWGSKITTLPTLMVFEFISLGIVLISIVIIWQSSKGNNQLWVRYGTWIVSGLFFLSAFANLFAENWIEKIVSVPFAFAIGVLACRVALKPKNIYKKDL